MAIPMEAVHSVRTPLESFGLAFGRFTMHSAIYFVDRHMSMRTRGLTDANPSQHQYPLSQMSPSVGTVRVVHCDYSNRVWNL